MKRIQIVLGVAMVLLLVAVVALPVFADKGGNGGSKDKKPPASSQSQKDNKPPASSHSQKDNKQEREEHPIHGDRVNDSPGARAPAPVKTPVRVVKTPTTSPSATTPSTIRPSTITLCHKPGTPAEKTLVLPASAAPGHLRHGDSEGACGAATATPVPSVTMTATPVP